MFILILLLTNENKGLSSLNHGTETENEMTLVTAYFNVDSYHRNEDVFLKFFKSWAGLKNQLIVYCENEKVRNKVLEIRKEHDLERETEAIIIPDIFSLNRKMYEKMCEISQNPYFLNFRAPKEKKKRENNPKYNYITNLKPFFLKKASVDFEIKTKNIGWIDFGFNHGGTFFSTIEENWKFELKCGFSDKITLFYISERVDSRPFFEVVRTVTFCIASGFFVCPKDLVTKLYNVYEKALHHFLRLDLMDADQPVFLLASRLSPEIFDFKKSFYFLPVKQYCSGGHLKLNRDYLFRMKVTEKERLLIEKVFSQNISLNNVSSCF